MPKPSFLALDTEFLRERTYYPQLCLVQVAPPEGEAILLDPLSGDDMTDLEEALFDPDVVKVFHAGRQDLEIFVKLYGRVPAPNFDTQVAGMALGVFCWNERKMFAPLQKRSILMVDAIWH